MCPNFFIHKWETRKNKSELMIEVPKEIDEILLTGMRPELNGEVEAEEQAYAGHLNEEQMKKRREQFSEELVAICYDFYHD